MRYPIPDDWNAETGKWKCIQIQWPDSPKWRSILAGIITTTMRGRMWDENSGVITVAQAVGVMIDQRNLPFVDCAGEQIITEYLIAGGCDTAECEDCEMSNCPEPPLKVEDGILYYWHCCAWVEIAVLPGAAAAEVVDPYEDVTPPPTYSACSKAKAIVDVIYLVADTVWENQLSAPWTWVGAVEHAVSGHNDLDDNQIISAYGDAIVINTLYDYADIFDPIDKQALLCGVVRLLDDTSAGITREQWDQMIGIINSNYGTGISDFFRACAEAVGPSDMREITALMSIEGGYDCGCPTAIQDPTTSWDTVWVYFKDFTRSQGDLATAHGGTHVAEYESGKGWSWSDEDNGYQDCSVDMQCVTPQAGATITRAWMLWLVPPDTTYLNTETSMQRQYLSQTILDQGDMSGGSPSVGGLLACQAIVSTSGEAATWPIKIRMEADCPVNTDKCYLVAIAFGGTGTSPFL